MTQKLTIEGMTCMHCVKHVDEALREIDGITSVKVDLKTNSAVIELSKPVDAATIKAAVDEAGYKVTNIA
jgi:copper ion binding protein